MSRSGGFDSRLEPRKVDPDREDRLSTEGHRGIPMDKMSLPRGPERQPVRVKHRDYQLRESEARTLATVGAFRVVRIDDLQNVRTSRDAWTGELRALADQHLIEFRTVEVNREAIAVAVLTREGKELLDTHRTAADGRQQAFYAGLVKPREVAHDAQLYRLYQTAAAEIEAQGGRVTRVILDYELKRDYQRYLNRQDRLDDDRQRDLETFAATARLPIVDGHLELPDLRIECETQDGRLEYRDLELVTEHYSRAQLGGKAAAGFALYRAAGAGRGRGASAHRGGTPFDPHHLERIS